MKEVKIIDVHLKSLLKSGTLQDAITCISDCMEIVNKTNSLVDVLRDWDSSSNIDVTEYADLRIEKCEDLYEILGRCKSLEFFIENALIKEQILYNKVREYLFIKDQFYETLDTVTLMGTALSSEDVDILKEYAVLTLELVPFFLLCEFDIIVSYDSMVSDEVLLVNEALLAYCNSDPSAVETTINKIVELNRTYRKLIPSFDLPEDILNAFYEMADLYAYGLDIYVNVLRVDTIKDIANGTLDAKDVLEELQNDTYNEKPAAEKKSTSKTKSAKTNKGGVNLLDVF